MTTLDSRERSPRAGHDAEHYETVIVGGGQAGLATGYHLARRDRPFVILDANERIGDSWRSRWDSLQVVHSRSLLGAARLVLPRARSAHPTKDEVADYLEAYAATIRAPRSSGVQVDRLGRNGSRYVVTSGDQRLEADNVVVATGAYQRPRVPGFASELDPEHRAAGLQRNTGIRRSSGGRGARRGRR